MIRNDQKAVAIKYEIKQESKEDSSNKIVASS